MKRSLALFGCVLLLPIMGYAEEELEGSGMEIFVNAGYEFQIFARLVEDREAGAVWDMEITRQTISGRAVSVRIEGDSLVVLAQFTPYQQTDDEILLVAQGQTWLTVPDAEGVRYRTAFKSVPLILGESLYFFPLGYKFSEEHSDGLNLEIEIKPYRIMSGSDE